MKLLLISANRERSPYPVFPIGLAYLAGPLAAAGHDLRVIDLCFASDPTTEIRATLGEFSPDAVIVSIRNMDNVTWPGSRSYLAGVREIVAACSGKGTVILGGSGFSLMPREVLDFVGGDYGVIGEGEEVLVQLLHHLERREPVTGIPGIIRRGEMTFLPPRHLERIGGPDRSLFDVQRYRREGGMANIQTKRGCPFGCIYCTYPNLEGARVRTRPVADVVAEVRELVDSGIDYIYFVDDIFNFPMDYALQLCRAISDDRLSFNWSAFINPGFMTAELLDGMLEAGCDAVEFGSDSGSPSMLQSMGKSFGVAEIREASRLCAEAGVDFAHYLLFGGPGETEETIDESFALMDEVNPTAVIAMTGIRIFPGTELYRRALAEGVMSADTSLLEPVFYLSPQLGERLGDLVTERAVSRKNWIAPGLEVNMSDSMMEALRYFPVRGPLWKLMKRLGRSRVRPLAAG